MEIYNGWGLERVAESGDGHVAGLEAKKCVSVFDEHGHFSPVYDDAHKHVRIRLYHPCNRTAC